MVAKALFVGGTASNVGKSWMATALCRHLYRRGIRVAPFKAQNMSNNSYPCADGCEIARAQVAQAEACGLVPTPDMNPVLLKPNSSTGSQVVINGRVWRNLSAREYYEHNAFLRGVVLDAYDRLAHRFEYIVIEGAGSIAEINLKRTDLANLALARAVNASGLLVASIDCGGVFASIIGTLDLLEVEEARVIRSFAVNRFRGDTSLFDDGVGFLREKTGRPCLGVFPYAADISVDQEDSVWLESRNGESDIGIIRLPRISNFTDFRLLPGAQWLTAPVERQFHCIILPGTKNTIEDLQWLRQNRLDSWIRDQHQSGTRVIGICGGYQMLGNTIEDPEGVEAGTPMIEGLGLLPVSTILTTAKRSTVVHARTHGGIDFEAYEIHMGATSRPPGVRPAFLPDEGVCAGGALGTYLHGALENAEVLAEVLGRAVLPVPEKQESYDRLSDWFQQHADQWLFEELYL